MKNPELVELARIIEEFFLKRHGYCGKAIGDKNIMFNSGTDKQNYIVRIEDKTEE